ncbi:MAG: DUF4421 domain-containing protein [Clostridium sp.]|nr:DUF4421 domain-containing protein [Clostridium sp.]
MNPTTPNIKLRRAVILMICFIFAATSMDARSSESGLENSAMLPSGEIGRIAVERPAVSPGSAVPLSDLQMPRARSGNWVRQLFEYNFRLNDPRINYPRFARFCLNVYNWGDRTFNSYDPDYVVSSGKNWKATVHSENWMQNFLLQFSGNRMVRIDTNPYFDLGATVSFMAVSLSYTVNGKTLFQHTEENRQRYNFNFTCALFAANIHYSSIEGGGKIRRFGVYQPVRHHPYPFNDISTRSFNGEIYYFFNHRRYSQAAAYCYSKYQLRSAGSWLAGIQYTRQNIGMDFSSLPEKMLEALPTDNLTFRFRYKSYNLSGGYAYNWAIVPRKWLINVGLMPAVGYRHTYDNVYDDSLELFSLNFRGMLAAVYNYKFLFAALTGNFYGHTYFKRNYTFFNSVASANLTVGVRF